MAIANMGFTPTTGLRDSSYSPTIPVSEGDIRNQVQGIPDQLRDYINNTLIPALIASNIPNTAIVGLVSLNVQAALAELKTQMNSLAAGSIPDGTLTITKMNNQVKTDLIGGQIYAYQNIGGGL